MKSKLNPVIALILLAILALGSSFTSASHISGIRITQTGNTGLNLNVDVTAFYTTGSTETTAYLGTYYNQVPALDWGDGSTVPRYGYGASTGIPLIATSTVVNGVPARAFRGSFSHTYGTAGSYSVAANTGCCPVTTPTYTLVSGSIRTTTISTSGPFGPTTFTTSFVQNTLAVDAVAPGFNKIFAPDAVPVGVNSTLTFTIDNTASTLDNNALDFTDNLPAGVTVATVPNITNTCTGGTVTAAPGTAIISYTGGLVAAGSSCTISVDVGSVLPGAYVNTSGDLTSAFGNSGTAGDTLAVTAVPPSFSKSFAPASVGIGAPSTLTFVLDNTANAAAASSVSFTDNLPAGLVIETPSNAATTCTGGTLTATSGTDVISYTGGAIAASSSCTVSVDVDSGLAGSYVNTSGNLTSAFGNSGTANATLTVGNMPAFTKAFVPASVAIGATSTLEFTLDNTLNSSAASAVAFIDNLPAGMTVATPANASTTCAGGVLTAAPGGAVVSYTGGTIPASVSCAISVDVNTSSDGYFINNSGDLTSVFGNSGTANATLAVGDYPAFTKAFSPTDINPNEATTLIFTIDNSANAVAIGGLAFTDNLPAGMVVASAPDIADTCTGGTVTAAPGASVITYANGSVAAGASCTISVNVTVTTLGAYTNIADPLMTDFGTSGQAAAEGTLIVQALAVPVMSALGIIIFGTLLGMMALGILRRRG